MSEDTDDGEKRRLKPYSPHYKRNDEGGFGNPPVSRQFPLKNPGGPGRPKGQTNIEAQIRKALRRKLTVNKDGKSVRMHPTAVFAERLLEAILSRTNSPKMLQFGLEILRKFGPQAEPSKSTQASSQIPDLTGLSDDELSIYGEMCAMVMGRPLEEDCTTSLGGPGNSLYRLDRGPDGLIRFERVG